MSYFCGSLNYILPIDGDNMINLELNACSGGHDGRMQLRDVWASADEGVSWTQVCQVAQWDGRQGHASVAIDGFVYLMGGFGGDSRFNDLWKSRDCGKLISPCI